MSLPDCLHHVLFTRYLPLSLKVVEKTEQMENCLVPNFLEGMTPTFLRQIVSAIYCTPFVLVEFYLLISVCEA